MKAVKIFLISISKAVRSVRIDGYSLAGWGGNTEHYEGQDDGGRDYNLPDHYHLGVNAEGLVEIYAHDENQPDNAVFACEIIRDKSGWPKLICGSSRHASILEPCDK